MTFWNNRSKNDPTEKANKKSSQNSKTQKQFPQFVTNEKITLWQIFLCRLSWFLSFSFFFFVFMSLPQILSMKHLSNAYQTKPTNQTKFPIWYMLNIINIISNGMCYTMLCMLECMRKGKHRKGTLRTRGLRDSALSAYIHGGIP